MLSQRQDEYLGHVPSLMSEMIAPSNPANVERYSFSTEFVCTYEMRYEQLASMSSLDFQFGSSDEAAVKSWIEKFGRIVKNIIEDLEVLILCS